MTKSSGSTSWFFQDLPGEYDTENCLIEVQEFAVGNPTAVTTSTYRYDGLG